MATSSITKNFVVKGEKQVEIFANAIEESFMENELNKDNYDDVPVTFIRGSKAVADFLKKREKKR